MAADEVDGVDGVDEVAGGAGREPVRFPRWLSGLAAVVVVVLAGYVALRPADGEQPASGARRLGPPAPISLTPAPGSTGYLPSHGPLALVGTTCLTFGRKGFTVTFGLQNNGLGRLTVLSVSAHLPLGGLEPTGGRVPARKACGGADIGPGTTTVLEPGDRVPASLGFVLPADCPAPFPVQVDVSIVGVGENPGTQRIPVAVDLGGYQEPFGVCVAT